MRRLAIIIALICLIASAFAQETIPDTLALSDEDAKACQVKACRTITDGAYNLISQKVQQLEERNARLADELKKRPARIYCI